MKETESWLEMDSWSYLLGNITFSAESYTLYSALFYSCYMILNQWRQSSLENLYAAQILYFIDIHRRLKWKFGILFHLQTEFWITLLSLPSTLCSSFKFYTSNKHPLVHWKHETSKPFRSPKCDTAAVQWYYFLSLF